MDQKKQITARIPHDLYENLSALDHPTMTDSLVHVLSQYFREENPEIAALESQICELEAIIAARELEHARYVTAKEDHIFTLKEQLDIANNRVMGEIENTSGYFRELVAINKEALALEKNERMLIPVETVPYESEGIKDKIRKWKRNWL